MRGTSIQALFTLIADRVDLTNHALTNPRHIICFDHVADELMPDHARVRIISLYQFEISAADPSLADLDQRFIWFARLRDIT